METTSNSKYQRYNGAILLQSFKETIVEKLLEAAKIMPFAYFVAVGSVFAVLFAFGLYALENYLFFGSGLSAPMVKLGQATL